MNHSQLRAFHAVATEASFTKAASVLRVGQPALSGHVRALEESYGVKLFRRGSREIEITPFGRELFEITQRYFAIESQARQLLTAAQGLAEGRLRVSADSPYFVIPLLAAFGRRYPKINMSVSFGNSKSILADTLNGTRDIGILPEVEPDRRLYRVPYQKDRLVAFVERGHSWAIRRSVKLDELREQTIILRETGSTTRSVFEAALSAAQCRIGHSVELGSREAVREAVAEGMGVGLVSEREIGHDARLHKLAIRGAKLDLLEYAICRSDRKDDPINKAFLQVVRSMAET